MVTRAQIIVSEALHHPPLGKSPRSIEGQHKAKSRNGTKGGNTEYQLWPYDQLHLWSYSFLHKLSSHIVFPQKSLKRPGETIARNYTNRSRQHEGWAVVGNVLCHLDLLSDWNIILLGNCCWLKPSAINILGFYLVWRLPSFPRSCFLSINCV